jgi:heme exporter protein C
VSSSAKYRDAAFYVLFALTVVAFIVEIQLIFLQAPVEKTMGIVQKIFYFHVPAAIAMYVAAIACFFGSAAYLYSPTDARDAVGKAGAEAAVAFGLIVLVTGPLWAAKAWGRYWTWDPRLTTSMLSVLIYVSYVVLRSFAGDGQAEKKFSAALGVVGAAMLPIIHYSVQKWSGQHPVVVGEGGGGLDKAMVPAFLLGMLAFTLLAILLVWARARVEMARARLRQLEEEAIALIPEEST